MSRHIRPHRWADALAGRVDAAERTRMDRHAATCQACAQQRRRIGRASESYGAIRAQAAPELAWDAVRARVHWSVSKERRSQAGVARRRVPSLAWAALAATAAGALAFVTEPLSRPAAGALATAPTSRPEPTPVGLGPAPVTPSSSEGAPAPGALAGLVNRTSGEVLIDGVQPAELFARRLVAGTVIATGEGRVDVQFGDASAFVLGPRSTLELRRFDTSMIELVVRGTVDLEVAPRSAGQRFVVVAGEHTIEVRGTQFRVSHDDERTTVACRHGLVAVRDRVAAQVEVGTARRIQLRGDAPLTPDRVMPLTVEELAVLADATPMRLPLWDVASLPHTSAPLEIATVGRREVRVDGVELGLAPIRVRVMPGRHTVEAADSAGRFRRAGWVDVAAPGAGALPARVEVPAESRPTAGIALRRRQLRAGIDPARLSGCVRSIAKAGLTDTYVQIELAVDAAGAVSFLNVIDTDLPSATARCVRGVLADVRFGAGTAATWREKLDL